MLETISNVNFENISKGDSKLKSANKIAKQREKKAKELVSLRISRILQEISNLISKNPEISKICVHYSDSDPIFNSKCLKLIAIGLRKAKIKKFRENVDVNKCRYGKMYYQFETDGIIFYFKPYE